MCRCLRCGLPAERPLCMACLLRAVDRGSALYDGVWVAAGAVALRAYHAAQERRFTP